MNKIRKIWIFVIASIAIVALAIPIALAQKSNGNGQVQKEYHKGKHGMRGGHDGFGMHGFMSKELNLSDVQKAKIKQIHDSFRENTKSLHEELRTKHKELRAASEGSTFNEALATQKLNEITGLQVKLMGEQFKLRQEMISVLTPEQKTKFEQLQEQFKSKRSERKSGGHDE